jgi:hypothetical protein
MEAGSYVCLLQNLTIQYKGGNFERLINIEQYIDNWLDVNHAINGEIKVFKQLIKVVFGYHF